MELLTPTLLLFSIHFLFYSLTTLDPLTSLDLLLCLLCHPLFSIKPKPQNPSSTGRERGRVDLVTGGSETAPRVVADRTPEILASQNPYPAALSCAKERESEPKWCNGVDGGGRR